MFRVFQAFLRLQSQNTIKYRAKLGLARGRSKNKYLQQGPNPGGLLPLAQCCPSLLRDNISVLKGTGKHWNLSLFH